MTLIGYQVAGIAGGIVATVAMCGPTALLSYGVSRVLHRASNASWPATMQAALVPLSIGLMCASAWVLAETTDRNWIAVTLMVAAAFLIWRTRINPLWLLTAGAALGFAGVVWQKSVGIVRDIRNVRAMPVKGETMSDMDARAPASSLPSWIKAPQDFFGGLALVALALFALWAASDLQGMRGFSFGAGTAPRIFAYLLLALGAAITVVGVTSEGPALAKYHWRGPLFVTLAILCFAFSIRPMGMIFSAMASFLVAALGSAETRWGETIIVGACLTTFCALLFPYALGLPLPMLPNFLIR